MVHAIAKPADRPTDDELVRRVHGIGEIIRANAAEAERTRRIPEESIRALTDAGLFRLGTPRRYGGYETSAKTMLDVSSAVAEYDGSTAWVVTLINVACWSAGLFSTRAQDEVWGTNPDAKVTGVLGSPTAEARPAQGGIRVSGKWYYNSGALHSEWSLLGAPRIDEDGTVIGHNIFIVPASEIEIEDTWFVAGMRGTGSNAVIAQDLFVPGHRVIATIAAAEGRHENELVADEPLYRSAWNPLLVLVLVGPQLGLARDALRRVTAQAATRAISLTTYAAERDSAVFQTQIARASLLIDSAHLHAYRSAADIDGAAVAGTYPDPVARSRVRAECGWVVELVRDAITHLIDAYGAGSYADRNPLQRIWRDSSVAAHHALLTPAVGYEVYGKQLLGVDEQVVPFI
ncbi:acyl-CoA dehydrogenase family protein [Amycolatopsis pithecellobii]|uniref:Oxidoreductase n=1 Tax=Amycolatopsis pithecellobii TaxID=664692 RepID=A0A6N7YR78_9PSEU|nr:acyl-CoA dehydrogenase family protein [Amycolatopsis pithecellobii]MTD55525.1 oxidoreductase [Amycolatopsis pithecellobii]